MNNIPSKAQTGPSLVPVAENVYAWIGVNGDSNAGVVTTPQGLIVIDAQQTEAQGRTFRQTIEETFGKPVIRLVNSHFHLDHIAGNIAFDDVPILAHERTGRILREMLGEEPAGGWQISDAVTKLKLFFGSNIEELLASDGAGVEWFMRRVSGPGYDTMTVRAPTESFADKFVFDISDDELRCEYWGPAHCDGDLIIHLPNSGVVFLGDLLFVGRFPWFGDCDLGGWVKRLDQVLQMDVKTVIPGHGQPSTLQEVAAFRALLAATYDAVRETVEAGLSEDAAVAKVFLPQYASMPRYDAWMPFNVRATYRALRGDG
ncbi:MAG: MBL fold metallo-hydrolase [Methylovirgula sp.]|uniref:MBL fold metallo-hydrolase n=1 Tax=Methylovirgula sp. TaxID=1978224 RepID=UPI00307687A0